MTMFRIENGRQVQLSADEEKAVLADWAVEAAAKIQRASEEAAAQSAAQKAAQDMATFVGGMKALLSVEALKPGALPEVAAAAAVDVSAVDTAVVLQP